MAVIINNSRTHIIINIIVCLRNLIKEKTKTELNTMFTQRRRNQITHPLRTYKGMPNMLGLKGEAEVNWYLGKDLGRVVIGYVHDLEMVDWRRKMGSPLHIIADPNLAFFEAELTVYDSPSIYNVVGINEAAAVPGVTKHLWSGCCYRFHEIGYDLETRNTAYIDLFEPRAENGFGDFEAFAFAKRVTVDVTVVGYPFKFVSELRRQTLERMQNDSISILASNFEHYKKFIIGFFKHYNKTSMKVNYW